MRIHHCFNALSRAALGMDKPVRFRQTWAQWSRDMEIYVMRNGEQIGRYSAQDAQLHLDAGTLLLSDLGWTEGQGDWKPLRDVVSEAGIDAAGIESAQTQEHTRKTHRILSAIHGFIDRHLTTRTVVAISV